MSTPDPFGDALADQAQSSASPDPYGAALAAQATQAPATASKDSSLLDKYLGFQEGQIAGATGGVASLAGGLGYLGKLALSGDPDAAKAVQQSIQSGLTYSPKTAEGKKQAEAMADAASYLGQKGGDIAGSKVAEVTGSPALGAAVNTAYNVPQFLLGAKGAKDLGDGIQAPEPVEATPQQAILKRGQDLGLVVPPSTANPTLFNKMAEGAAGKISTAQLASIKNQPIIDSLAKKDLGLPDDAELTQETLAQVRTAQSPAYQAIQSIPQIKLGPQYTKDLGALTSSADKIASELPDYKATGAEKVQDLVKSLQPPSGSLSGTTAVELSKSLRSEASSYEASANRTLDPGDKAMGRAYRGAATAIENAIQDHLTATGQPDLAANWDNARRTIAKTYSVQDALDGSGHVDASKLAKQSIKGKPLSDNLEAIADFANTFPKSTKLQWSKESVPGLSPLDVYGGAGLGVAAALHEQSLLPGLAGAAVPITRMGTRAALMSKAGQKVLTGPSEPGTPGSLATPLGQGAIVGLPNGSVQNRE